MNLATLRATLEDVVSRASLVELPTVVGEFERAKAMAYAKLVPAHGDSQSDYLTVGEVVDRLRLSRARVYELIRCGNLPVVKWGTRGTRIRRADLEQWEKRPKVAVAVAISTMLKSSRDRRRASSASNAAQAHAGAVRSASRGPSRDGLSVGNGSREDP